MVFIDAELFGHIRGDGLIVAGEHDGVDALRAQGVDGGARAGLEEVGDDDRAEEGPAARDIDDGADAVIRHEGNPRVLHELGVAGKHRHAVDGRLDAAAGDLLRIGDAARVGRCGQRFAQALADRVVGIAFGQSRGLEQLGLGHAGRGAHPSDRKVAFGQGAGLIQHDGIGMGKRFEVVAALDQDAAARRPADTAEKAQRDADHERAGAGDDEEGQRAANPHPPPAAEHERRQHGQRKRRDADSRGVVPRELGDEVLGFGFFQAGIFNKVENPRDG